MRARDSPSPSFPPYLFSRSLPPRRTPLSERLEQATWCRFSGSGVLHRAGIQFYCI